MIIANVTVEIEDKQDFLKKKSFIFLEFKVLQKGEHISA